MPTNTRQFIGIIEAPGAFDTVEAWEQHLAEMEAMDIHPDNAPSKAQLLCSAREMIAWKKKEGGKIS